MTAVLDPARLRALALAATPGPWVDERNLGWKFPQTEVRAPDIGRKVAVLRNGELDVSCTIGNVEQEWANAAYIAAANPAAVLHLLALHDDRCAEVLKLMDRLRFVEADYERRLLERDKEIVRLQAIESDASWTRNPDRSGS